MTATLGAPRPHSQTLLRAGEVHLWTARLDAFAQDLDAARWLPGDERAAAARILAPLRRRQYVAGRALLRALLRRHLGHAAGGRSFRYLAEGKPILDGAEPELHFNLAHCGELVAVALATSGPLGVDLERIRPLAHTAAIARAYFTEGERAWLSSLDEEARAEAFLILWTGKEAAVKASGRGISGGWTDLEVVVGPAGSVAARSTGAPRESWHLIRPALAGHVITVAVPDPAVTVRTFAWNVGDPRR